MDCLYYRHPRGSLNVEYYTSSSSPFQDVLVAHLRLRKALNITDGQGQHEGTCSMKLKVFREYEYQSASQDRLSCKCILGGLRALFQQRINSLHYANFNKRGQKRAEVLTRKFPAFKMFKWIKPCGSRPKLHTVSARSINPHSSPHIHN